MSLSAGGWAQPGTEQGSWPWEPRGDTGGGRGPGRSSCIQGALCPALSPLGSALHPTWAGAGPGTEASALRLGGHGMLSVTSEPKDLEQVALPAPPPKSVSLSVKWASPWQPLREAAERTKAARESVLNKNQTSSAGLPRTRHPLPHGDSQRASASPQGLGWSHCPQAWPGQPTGPGCFSEHVHQSPVRCSLTDVCPVPSCVPALRRLGREARSKVPQSQFVQLTSQQAANKQNQDQNHWGPGGQGRPLMGGGVWVKS